MTEESKVVIRPNVEEYVGTRSASGSKSYHTNDDVANALEGATVEEVKTVAAAIGVDDVNKYDHLNAGQIRMNLGNRIRGLLAKMEKENEGSAVKALEKAAAGIRKAVTKRAADAEKEAEEKAKAKEAAKAEKADAKPKRSRKKAEAKEAA